ncbi:hypothetical protein Kisp01_64360 [Kineosporia sp. NBRC 101677]|uniref:TIGR02677 family protein n=1 Tax=Kineosporia sp. NBRC 101677 TaxID=3032197 RepID=UPI0024A174EF|nr:TIGR02677 family protein [Kineosporia sp. NBRC 101677]GLY19422.1 hypothetical protein Kisp01_64360 [Kineosporia sp. NBRC 101677]
MNAEGDAWGTGRAGAASLPSDLFRFTTGERSEVYTAVLQVFGEANERLETALGLDEVGRRLSGLGWVPLTDEDTLFDVLRQLREWRLLEASQNHAGNYRTADEYERRNLLYSLTRHGEAALAGLEHAAAVLASAGALQTAVLEAIALRLGDLARLAADPSTDDRRVFTTLQELEGHLDGLRTNTTQFNAQLQRLLRVEGTDQQTFHEVKQATVVYLNDFLGDLDLRVRIIAEAVDEVERHDVVRLRQRALAGAELPRLSAADDPGPEWLHHRRTRWEGLRAWFRPDDGSPARAEQLHTVARRAIVTLLQALDRLNESRRRSSGAAEDLRELARWFAAAPTENDAHRLWSAAFGLGSARHAHLQHSDPELVPPGTAWAEAPPVPVSALIRTSGRTERFGRTGKVRDVAAVKRARAQRARDERAELEAARQALATDGPVRLSRIGQLDHQTFQRLLDLIGGALGAAPDAQGTRRHHSGDGQIEITLWPAEPGPPAVIRTSHGVLTGPDYLVRIDTRTGARGARSSEVGA